MAFDQKTRNLLQRTVAACRRVLDREFTAQLQELYGIQPEGSLTPVAALDHLGDEELEVARLLRERLNHLAAALPAEAQTRTRARPEHVSRVIREQAFTVLNRLAALRLCEERGLVLECVRKGTSSEGFQLFLASAGPALGATHEAYGTYLHCLFAELSLDLGVLFDRFSPLALLFPRRDALEEVLHELNGSGKAAAGEGLSPQEFAEIWQADETIGWIYQYYNDEAERKQMREESSAPRNSRELAVRNQFFTPRYVVEFLTDNTLGRLWYEMTRGITGLRDRCRYLVRRPQEIFLGSRWPDIHPPRPGSWVARVAQGSLQDLPETADREDLDALAFLVDGYAAGEHLGWPNVFERCGELLTEHFERGQPLPEDLHQVWLCLFACVRGRVQPYFPRHHEPAVRTALYAAWRRLALAAGKTDHQADLLRQPVLIPARPLKDPREIRLLDPACGSMHFGLYAFDLFTVIYEEAWDNHPELLQDLRTQLSSPSPPSEGGEGRGEVAAPTPEEARRAFLQLVPKLIVEHNLHGIDIDPRAAQIAGLSLWLRAQRAWHQAGVKPADRPRITRSNLVCAEPMPGEKELLREFVEQQFPAGERPAFAFLLEKIFDCMTLAGEAGSLLRIEEEIRAAIAEAKRLWKQGPKVEQAMMFSEPGEKAGQGEMRLDLSGITDEQFWERAEQRIYDALEAYAEQAENGGGFQRRLFADDAAQGFAFIDLCRKRYDVAVMNPPFGVCASAALEYVRGAYPIGYIDLFTAFIDRGCELNCESGMVGAITSRTGFFLSSFEAWRRNTLLGKTRLTACIDLGQGVLDGAMVETAAYTIARSDHESSITFFRLSEALNKEDALLKSLANTNEDVFVRRPNEMLDTPAATIAYSMSAELAEDFRTLPSVDKLARIVRGSATSDDERFIRTTWEIPPDALVPQVNRRWRWLSKGGDFGAFYAPIHLVLEWKDDGGYLGEFMYQKRPRNGYLWGPKSWSREFIGKPGVVWPLRSQKGVSFRVLPADCAFSHKSPAVMSGDQSTDFALLAVLNTHRIQRLADCLTTFGSYEMGVIGSLPVDSTKLGSLSSLGQDGFDAVRGVWSMVETDPNHVLLTQSGVTGLGDFIALLKGRVDSAESEVSQVLKAINTGYVECDGLSDERHEGALDSIKEELDSTALVSELFGIALGRWDIRYATGERPAPELPDPFAPLPVCPPGMLQGDDGLPLSPEAGRRLRAEGRYPLDVAWDGILVDDPEHPLDLERRVHAALETIWSSSRRKEAQTSPSPPSEGGEGRGVVGPSAGSSRGNEAQTSSPNQSLLTSAATAESIQHEACALLGVPTLREWFRRPSGFFADHLKRYSKSRRQAPIYWPLSTASGSYTLWIYYHRLTPDTLYKCVQQFVNPKLADVEKELTHLRTVLAANEGGAKERKRLEELEDLRRELIELRTELELWAPKWKPNLNDGVLITACPLWKLFRLPKWQKDLKACWLELEKGDYDWAHLAHTLWPDRVREKCKSDRSLAIAHGLEELCEVKAPEKKAKKAKTAKKKAASDQMEINDVQET